MRQATSAQRKLIRHLAGLDVTALPAQITQATITVCERNGWIRGTDTWPYHEPTDDGRIAAEIHADGDPELAASAGSERHAELIDAYGVVTRAAREADSAAYQRELIGDLGLGGEDDPAPIAAGDTVVRIGEESPQSPRGKVVRVSRSQHTDAADVAQVSWSGLSPMPIAVDRIRRVDPIAEQEARDAHSSAYWQQATEGLPREAAFHAPTTSDPDQNTESAKPSEDTGPGAAPGTVVR